MKVVLALLALAIAPLAACDLPDDVPDIRDFRLTEPASSVELVPVPGNQVRFAWTSTHDNADGVVVGIDLLPTGSEAPAPWLTSGPLADGAATYAVVTPPVFATPVLPIAPPPPPGVYRARATAWLTGAALVEDTAAGLFVVQGATFRDRELTFTADVNERDIWLTTVTASEARAVVFLAEHAGAPRSILSDATIASDLAPVGRVVTFTGRTVDDVAIPPGTYAVFVEVQAHDNAQRYVVGGLTIHWQP